MSAPITPSDVEATATDVNSSMCENFQADIKQRILFKKFIDWMLTESGDLTADFLRGSWKPGDLKMSAAPLSEDANWLLCDGRAVAQATYPELYAAISDMYDTDVPAGAGNFRLPDFGARFPVGVGTFESSATVAIGQDVGAETHLLTPAEGGFDPGHKHIVGRFESGVNGDVFLLTTTDESTTDGTAGLNTGGGAQPEENLSDQTGLFVETAAVEGAPAAEDYTPLSLVPPGKGVYIYIKT